MLLAGNTQKFLPSYKVAGPASGIFLRSRAAKTPESPATNKIFTENFLTRAPAKTENPKLDYLIIYTFLGRRA